MVLLALAAPAAAQGSSWTWAAAALGGSGLAGVFGVAGLLHKAQAEPPIKPRKQHVVTRSFGYAVSDLFPTANCKAATFSESFNVNNALGSGAFGQVLTCTAKATGTTFAVKVALDLTTEVMVMKRLTNHSNTVSLHAVFHEKERMYVVMTLCSGRTLRDELYGDLGDSTESEIATVICHVLTGLSYMHGCGVAHRDLKPDNIMYSRESGSVRIIDYGLAKIYDEGVRMRTVTGTLGYTAPEVFGATGYNMLCDTWSVGIITYYLLSGGLPFDGMQDIVVKRRIRTEQAKLRDEEWSLLSQEALNFTQVMLNTCPALRPTAAAALDHIWFSLDVEANGVKIGEFGPYATSLSILSSLEEGDETEEESLGN